MLLFVLRKVIKLLEKSPDLLVESTGKDLLDKACLDLKKYKHINCYDLKAGKLLQETIDRLQGYKVALNGLADRLKKVSDQSAQNTSHISEITNVIILFEKKQKQLQRLQSKIPEGMLDVKRAIYIANTTPLSKSATKEALLQKNLSNLKQFMGGLNEQYSTLIKEGGALNSLLLSTTRFYWAQLSQYAKLLKHNLNWLENCEELTPAGQLALRCFKAAVTKVPPQKSIDCALVQLDTKDKSKATIQKTMSGIGFYAQSGRKACVHLCKLGKKFFHLPHSESMYHFDYDPTEDVADTYGNCFGESMLSIQSLTQGRFKRICPEAGLINYQIDQSRTLKCAKQTLGEGETEVSATSKHQSLQWLDVHRVFLNNDRFKPGDLCGILFSMNDYSKSKYTVMGHITVLAKLDPQKSPYKYVLVEKDLGTFGLEDDESLAYVIEHHVLPIYASWNYSRMKLVKYEEATSATYGLLKAIKPINSISGLRAEADTKASSLPLFFHTGGGTMEKDEYKAYLPAAEIVMSSGVAP